MPDNKTGYIVIGDIHGSLIALTQVLKLCEKYPIHKLIFLGDYIDGGPDSDTVITQLQSINGVFLIGNHEISLIRSRNGLPGKLVPEHEKNSPIISDENFKWISTKLRKMYITDDYIFVHAGLDITRTLKDQKEIDLLWSRYDGNYAEYSPKIVIHGHTGVDKIQRVGNRVNINTNAGYGGPVTALILPEWEVIQSDPTPGTNNALNIEKIKQELEELMKQFPSNGN